MEKKLIDARGLSCPEPVVLTKKAFDKYKNFRILVDNETSKENISRFVKNILKAECSVKEINEDWEIEL